MTDEQEPIKGSLADSIAMLEQILEVMPQDEEALKAVYNAYAQGGYHERAFDYLSRLVNVVSGGGRDEVLGFVQKELPRFEDKYPSEVAAQIARLRVLSGSDGNVTPVETKTLQTSVDASASERAGVEIDISEELALAWRLYEEGQLEQEEYSSVLHDLTEVSSKDVDVPVTVLHVLNDRGSNQIRRIMAYLSARSGVPFVNLAQYELNEDLVSVVPMSCAVHDGALPFSMMGEDLLIAVLNPFNNALVEKAESESGRRCHAYLVGPEDYDAALGKLKALVAAGS